MAAAPHRQQQSLAEELSLTAREDAEAERRLALPTWASRCLVILVVLAMAQRALAVIEVPCASRHFGYSTPEVAQDLRSLLSFGTGVLIAALARSGSSTRSVGRVTQSEEDDDSDQEGNTLKCSKMQLCLM
eukprot:TRINITY_DN15604_c0_g1_i2.p1 TRINITY_DN15604_c0_g1~~TRINITY_DN15604_c0_g1_i2.p1  ORF type:complete len:131 (+),score=30.14 TRINITY_DN15604_c0_g1_i2:139-531(+)